MDRSRAEEIVRDYVDGWKEYNSAKLRDTLDQGCVLVESDGAIIRGAETIVRQLEKRVAGEHGPWQISQWEITSLAVTDEACFLEWTFDGRRSFEGASLVRFNEGKISYVREYRTTGPLIEYVEE